MQENDGGSEITNYIVERREVNSNAWTPVSQFVPGTSCTVSKLQEGHSYMFRVMAQNALGVSDPLETEDAVLAKDPFGVPGKVRRTKTSNLITRHFSLGNPK